MRFSIVLVLLSVVLVTSVDRSKFKSCDQSGFCKRCRSQGSGSSSSPYQLLTDTVHVTNTKVETLMINTNNNVRFRMELFGLKDNTFRVKINEAYPAKPRFEVPLVLVGEPEQVEIKVLKQDNQGFTVAIGEGDVSKAVVTASPFRMDFYTGDVLVLSSNARGLMKFEHLKKGEGENVEEQGQENGEEEEDAGQESFGGHTDSKPNGNTAVTMDFSFVGMKSVYGIPQHADTFSLKDTSSTDPYRLYNLDVFEFELWNPMALYASIPFMIGHNAKNTVGVFWLNAAEGWIDVKKGATGILGSLSNMMSGGSPPPQVDTHWMFESGIMDVFVLLGPGPKDVSRQYGHLTGNTPLPPEFAIGYHQCRWNYNDQDDVRAVEQKFDEHDIPMDVMWLDIEHTDGKKYFTWDGRKFGDSIGMTDNLTAHGRKLVTIVDPHIKKDSGYWVYSDLTDKDLWVKTKDGNNYDGWCWPGSSYYPDFLNPEARQYFAEQYKLENYKGSTLDTYTWNDMNEPSVFNGPEVTMPKDVVHPYGGGWEHRDLHNMYGFLYTIGTNQGHLLRSDNQLRPFILTRSAYAGSQRFAAIWTGDNKADWEHLESSIPMCLSLGVAGMSFCGADVGGFFGNPDGELFVRWYQAAAFQPFFRSHAHIDTKRREPWLFSAGELSIIRKTIRARYSFLPMWYTLFYEGERFGVPPMRPLWYEFPEDEGTFDREGIHMIGNALLVAPVMKSGETKVTVYFPGSELWYDIWTGEKYDVHGEVNVVAPYDKIPVFQKGGTIIPRRERIRRSATLMHNDPVTLYVAPDKAGHAEGTLYLDDGKSYTYRSGHSIYVKITYDNGSIQAKLVDPVGAETKVWLEKVVIQGVKSRGGECKVKGADGEVSVEATYDNNRGVVVVRKPGVNMATEWTIQC